VTGRSPQAVLPAAAVVAVAGVLGLQLSQGGGTFEPLRPADPCAVREVTSQADGIDGLSERLVLLGLDGAACEAGTTREEFALEVAQAESPTDEQVDALRAGLHEAVRRMADEGTLPPASELLDDALDQADLNPFVEAALRAIPASVVDATLKTDDVLTRTIDDLDLRALLTNLDDEADLQRQIQAAVTRAATESVVDRLRNLG